MPVEPLIRVCFITCWARPVNVALVNVSAITSVSYLQGQFYWIHVCCVTVWPLSKIFLHTPIRCMHPFGEIQDISASINSYNPNTCLCWFIHDYFTWCVRQNGWRLERPWNFMPISIRKCCICFLKFLLVFDHWSMLENFYVIYVLVRFNHLYMKVKKCSDGLGWSFPEIFTQAIILCEPLLHWYN